MLIRHERCHEHSVGHRARRSVCSQTTPAAGLPRAAQTGGQELRKLAAKRMAEEAPGNTLNATALLHEAYLRLVGPGDEDRWDNRGHFFAAAAEAMRRILVDAARRKLTEKHGGRCHRVNLPDVRRNQESCRRKLLALNAALTRLDAEDPAAAQVVELRHFAGLSIEEAPPPSACPGRQPTATGRTLGPVSENAHPFYMGGQQESGEPPADWNTGRRHWISPLSGTAKT